MAENERMDNEKMNQYIMKYSQQVHEKNKKRTSIGIACVLLIPAIFLVLMFSMPVSKSTYLVLWIVSLFAISAYLIGVEYMDYKMQEQLHEIGLKENDEKDSLLETNVLIEKIRATMPDDLLISVDMKEDSPKELPQKAETNEEKQDKKIETVELKKEEDSKINEPEKNTAKKKTQKEGSDNFYFEYQKELLEDDTCFTNGYYED